MIEKMIPMAICYDFDGTLSPGYMQEYGFMKSLNINPNKFWSDSFEFAKLNNADRTSAYMYQMILEARCRNFKLTKKSLVNFGKSVVLFKGVDTWFDRINKYAKSKGVFLKHYIVSSGIKEIVEGTVIAKKFYKIFASSFVYDKDGIACWPAVVLNYTNKTQFLSRINKGFEDIFDDSNINKYQPDEDRSVLFKNIVYVGDGETDVPSMKMVKKHGGHSIAVYKRGEKSKTECLLEYGRVDAVLPADYSENSKIEMYLKSIIDKIS